MPIHTNTFPRKPRDLKEEMWSSVGINQDFKITKDFSTRHAIMIQNLCQSTTFCALGPQNYREFFQAIQKISSCGYELIVFNL